MAWQWWREEEALARLEEKTHKSSQSKIRACMHARRQNARARARQSDASGIWYAAPCTTHTTQDAHANTTNTRKECEELKAHHPRTRASTLCAHFVDIIYILYVL